MTQNPRSHSNLQSVSAWNRESFSLADIYLALRNTPSTPAWIYFHGLIKERFNTPDIFKSIEIGCGYGKFSLCANLIGCQTTLIDYNRSTLKQTKQIFAHFHRSAEILLQDALDLPEAMIGKFDFSFSFGTAEHFIGSERLRIIQAHADVLKPGGTTMICVPNWLCLPYRFSFGLRRLVGLWPKNLPEVPFSRKELIHLGHTAKLKNCRVLPCTFFVEDFRYWIGENVKSVFRKLTGYPRKPARWRTDPPVLGEVTAALKEPPPLQMGLLDTHACYVIALLGEKA